MYCALPWEPGFVGLIVVSAVLAASPARAQPARPAPRTDPRVTVLVAGRAGEREAAALFAEDTRATVVVAEPAEIARALDDEACGDPRSLLVVIDGDEIAVNRCRDGLLLRRALRAGTVAGSPYAAAVAARELAALAAVVPALDPSTAPRPTSIQAPHGRPVDRPPLFGAHFELGIALRSVLAGTASTVAPTAAVELDLLRARTPFWIAARASITPFGRRRTTVDSYEVRYARDAGALDLLVGRTLGRSSLVLGLELDVARVAVSATGPDASGPEHARWRLGIGTVAELRQRLVGDFGLALSVAAAVSPGRVRYLVRGVAVEDDAPWWVRATLALTYDP